MTTYAATQTFDELQRKLVPLWESIGRSDNLGGPTQKANTVVVIPSMTIDKGFTAAEQQAYEERMLFMLFLLRQPNIYIIYVTSQSIDPSIVDYYLSTLPTVTITNARKRLFFVSPRDSSSDSLTEKLLARPRLIEHIRSLIPDPDHAHMVPYTTTDIERELAVRLGVPMYAADPRFFAFGTKSGGRKIFAEEGVPHPLGVENLSSVEDAISAIAGMRVQKPTIRRAIVKLNEGVAGEGNAVVDLEQLPPPGDPRERAELAERLRGMRFELPTVRYEWYAAKLEEHGGVVEEMIMGEDLRSPSAQMRVSPLGQVELLSTHDQILGGAGGQSYLGARFPADPAYGPQIMREAAKVGARLAREGIIGRFAMDFVVVRSGAGWEPYAIEINLRKGGTTHPFLTLQYLTDGAYNPESGMFTTLRGRAKCYVATDHLDSHAYRVFTPDDLFDLVSKHRLNFDHVSQNGVVLHMLGGVGALGRLGMTAIADTAVEAQALYTKTVNVLDEEARIASVGTQD